MPFVLDNFSIFQLIVLQIHGLGSLLQCLKMKLPLFGGLNILELKNFVTCVGNLFVLQCQLFPEIEKTFHSSACISITAGLIETTKATDERFQLFEES